jgi:hypothetical protein
LRNIQLPDTSKIWPHLHGFIYRFICRPFLTRSSRLATLRASLPEERDGMNALKRNTDSALAEKSCLLVIAVRWESDRGVRRGCMPAGRWVLSREMGSFIAKGVETSARIPRILPR